MLSLHPGVNNNSDTLSHQFDSRGGTFQSCKSICLWWSCSHSYGDNKSSHLIPLPKLPSAKETAWNHSAFTSSASMGYPVSSLTRGPSLHHNLGGNSANSKGPQSAFHLEKKLHCICSQDPPGANNFIGLNMPTTLLPSSATGHRPPPLPWAWGGNWVLLVLLQPLQSSNQLLSICDCHDTSFGFNCCRIRHSWNDKEMRRGICFVFSKWLFFKHLVIDWLSKVLAWPMKTKCMWVSLFCARGKITDFWKGGKKNLWAMMFREKYA